MAGQRCYLRQRGATRTACWTVIDGGTGSRRQRTKGGFPTDSTARQFLNSTLGSVEAGTYAEPSKMTLREFTTEYWLPAQESRGLVPTTVSSILVTRRTHPLVTRSDSGGPDQRLLIFPLLC